METLSPANHAYVAMFSARSGSSWLTSMLSGTGRLGNPEEYLNPEFIREVAKAENSRNPEGVLQMLKRRRKTSNGVFGIEVRHIDVELFSEETFFQIFDQKTVFFHLRRDNFVAQGISLFRAISTQRFHSTKDGEDLAGCLPMMPMISVIVSHTLPVPKTAMSGCWSAPDVMRRA